MRLAQELDRELGAGLEKPFGGLLFAHVGEIGVKGRPRRIRVVVETVEIDPVLDDARFRMPL